MNLTFEIDPVPKGRPRLSTRGGFARAYTPLKTRQFETELQILARRLWKQPPLTGALYVGITFYVPIANKKKWGTPHDKRPDIDNFIKTMDAFNGILWNDDVQIAELYARKVYTEKGRIDLYVKTL